MKHKFKSLFYLLLLPVFPIVYNLVIWMFWLVLVVGAFIWTDEKYWRMTIWYREMISNIPDEDKFKK